MYLIHFWLCLLQLRLWSSSLIEGRKPKVYVSKHIAQKVGRRIEYSGHKGLLNKSCDELLWKLLPDLLDEKQKKSKITNLLTKLRSQGKIKNESQGPNSDWYIN